MRGDPLRALPLTPGPSPLKGEGGAGCGVGSGLGGAVVVAASDGGPAPQAPRDICGQKMGQDHAEA
jgi:hypothetical protein